MLLDDLYAGKTFIHFIMMTFKYSRTLDVKFIVIPLYKFGLMYFGYLEKVCSTQQTRLHVPNRKTKYDMCLFLPFKCLYLFQVQVIYVWLIKQSFKTMAGSKCKEIFFLANVDIHPEAWLPEAIARGFHCVFL